MHPCYVLVYREEGMISLNCSHQSLLKYIMILHNCVCIHNTCMPKVPLGSKVSGFQNGIILWSYQLVHQKKGELSIGCFIQALF